MQREPMARLSGTEKVSQGANSSLCVCVCVCVLGSFASQRSLRSAGQTGCCAEMQGIDLVLRHSTAFGFDCKLLIALLKVASTLIGVRPVCLRGRLEGWSSAGCLGSPGGQFPFCLLDLGQVPWSLFFFPLLRNRGLCRDSRDSK